MIAPNPAPTLTSISPASAAMGSADATIMLTGANFVGTSTANLNGMPIATTFVSATSLTAVIPATSLATAGALSVTVVTPAPGGGTSAGQTFTVGSSLSLDSTMTGDVFQDVSGNFSVVTTPPDAIVTWDFGDGTSSAMGHKATDLVTGHNVTHIYAVPGTYLVTITVQDPRTGATIVKTIMVTVAGLSAKAPGTLGGTTGIRVRQCKIKLDPAKNSIRMNAVLHLSAGEVVSGSTLTVSVNGVTKSFVLNSNGRAQDATGTLKLSYRANPNSALDRESPLTYTLTGSDFATLLKTGVAADAQGLPMAVVCTFAVNGRTLSYVTPVTFRTSGTTKIATFGLGWIRAGLKIAAKHD